MRRFMDRMAEIISRYCYRTAFTDGKETLTDLELAQESAKTLRLRTLFLNGKMDHEVLIFTGKIMYNII